MPRWYEVANEASFKSAPGGHVFQAPSPWVLARPRYYLVSDAQKAELLASLLRWRLLIMLALVVDVVLGLSFMLPIILWPKTFVGLFAPLRHQLGADLFAVAMGVLGALLMVPIFALPQIYLARAFRPVLANAPRTDERIRIAEQLAKLAASLSGWVLACGLIVGLAAMGGSFFLMFRAFRHGHLAPDVPPSAVLFIMSGLLTAYVAYLVRLRLKSKRTQTV
jgi:hypothetical protein